MEVKNVSNFFPTNKKLFWIVLINCGGQKIATAVSPCYNL